MSPDEMAKHVLANHPDLKACYLSVQVPFEIEDRYTIDVEISEGDIAATFEGGRGMNFTSYLAGKLNAALTARGVAVFMSYDNWHQYLCERSEQ